MRVLAALALLATAMPALAQVRPNSGPGDPRLQTIQYDADQVVQLAVASGYQMMVSFAPGERVETIAVGDSAAWQVTTTKRGDMLFVKNTGASAATNLTIVTDARVYNFELVASGEGEPAFGLRFTYPEPQLAVRQNIEQRGLYRYRLAGSAAIRPSAVGNDGIRTTLSWPATAALPAIYRIDEDGTESLADSAIESGAVIVAGSPKKLIFRLDRQIATATRVRVRGKRR
jgi:type IV secretion system protein VirB9